MSKGHRSTGNSESVSTVLRGKVRNWLIEDGYRVEDRTEAELSWFFVAIDQDGFGLGVSQPVGRTDVVFLRTSVTIEKPFQDHLAGMERKERNQFLTDFRLRMLSIEVEFQPEPKDTLIMESITLSERMFSEGLTKDGFFRRLFLLRRGTLAVIWMFDNLLPDAPGGELGLGRSN